MPLDLPMEVYVTVRFNAQDGEWLDLGTVSVHQDGARSRTNALDQAASREWRQNNRPVRIKKLWLAERSET